MGDKRTLYLHTACIIVLIVGTLLSFNSNYKMSVGNSEENLAKAENEYTISDTSEKNLEIVGQYDGNIGSPYLISVDGEFLYVKSYSAGIVKMDISNPIQPNIVGIHKNDSESYMDEFCVQNNIAYLTNYDYLLVVNITDINNLVEINRIQASNYYFKIKIFGNLLMITEPYYSFNIYDITNPANMILMSTLNLTLLDFNPQSFDYANDKLYLLGRNNGGNSTLVIYDVTDINNPIYAGNYTTPYRSSGRKVIVEGSIAYVMNEYDLLVINIINSTSPSLIKAITLAQKYPELRDMILAENILYVLNYSTLITVDISNSSNVSIVKKINEIDCANLAIKENFLYMTNPSFYKLLIYDVLSPNNPQKVNTIYFGGYSNDVCVENKVAFVANRGGGLQILDVSDVRNPKIIGTYRDGDRFDLLQVSGSILYAIAPNCLKLIDVTNPRNPVLLGEYHSTPDYASFREIIISENTVFLLHDYNGIDVIDVTNKANPILLSNYNAEYIFCLDIRDNYIFASCDSGFLILDASDLTEIKEVSKLTFEDEFIFEIAVKNDRAYLLSRHYELGESIQLVSINNLRMPKLLGITYINLGNSIRDIEISGNYLYLASNWKGLIVLRNNFDKISYVGQLADINIDGFNLVIKKGYVFMASGYKGITIFKAFTSLTSITIMLITAGVIAFVAIVVLVIQVIRTSKR